MTRKSGFEAALAIALALAGVPAHAAPDAKEPVASPSISISATPIFGADAAAGNGWFEIVARIENTGTSAQKGTVEIATSALYGGGDAETMARAPYNVPAGRVATVKIPAHGSAYFIPQITVTAITEGGVRLSSTPVNVNGSASPLLVDVDQPSRLTIPMRSWPIVASWNPGSTGAGYASSALTVGAPSYDRATGDPILPDRAAAYSSATVVLIHSDTLTALEEARLDALVGWVISGGTLAIVPSRPEDLRGPLLTTLAGGPIAVRPASPALLRLPVLEKPASAPSIGSAPSATEEEDDKPAPGAPMQFKPAMPPFPAKPPFTPRALRYGPSAAVKDKLAGYSGGNLRASDFGASAPYGSGEVHLLAFDPTASPMLEDPWVHSRIVEMVTRAWDRRSWTAFPLGGGDHAVGRMDEVRRALDPNENFRIGLGISALLLVVYSLVAGPLTFMRAAKRGKPMAPLLWVPLWSAIAFGAIVVVGLAGKGWRGRARHLSLVEGSAGFSRATVRRYRGFFASEARSLAVSGADRASVLEVAQTDGGSHVDYGTLRIDRNGLTLGDLTSLPWQTVVIREDGFVDLRGGVTIWPTEDGSVSIVNRTGHLLKDVVVHVPGSDLAYITTIADGETVKASEGRALASSTSGPPQRTTPAGMLAAHPLGARDIQAAMGGRDGERVGNAWDPIESAAGDAIDWWPDGVPVIIAEIVGAPKAARDAGLALESDRVLVRIVGTGGAP